MTEKATGLLNEVSTMIRGNQATGVLNTDPRPVTWLINDGNWPEAIKQVDEAIDKLNLVREELQSLV